MRRWCSGFTQTEKDKVKLWTITDPVVEVNIFVTFSPCVVIKTKMRLANFGDGFERIPEHSSVPSKPSIFTRWVGLTWRWERTAFALWSLMGGVCCLITPLTGLTSASRWLLMKRSIWSPRPERAGWPANPLWHHGRLTHDGGWNFSGGARSSLTSSGGSGRERRVGWMLVEMVVWVVSEESWDYMKYTRSLSWQFNSYSNSKFCLVFDVPFQTESFLSRTSLIRIEPNVHDPQE